MAGFYENTGIKKGRTAEEALASGPRPFPICGRTNKSGGPCGNAAGMGTEHNGIGACRFHGGTTPFGDKNPNYKHGLTSKVTMGKVHDLAQELVDSRDVFDIRDHIFLLEAMAIQAVNSGVSEKAADLLMKAVKSIKQLHEIEVGRKYVIDVKSVKVAMDQVVAVIQLHVRDKYSLDQIAKDLMRLDLMPQPALEEHIEGKAEHIN